MGLYFGHPLRPMRPLRFQLHGLSREYRVLRLAPRPNSAWRIRVVREGRRTAIWRPRATVTAISSWIAVIAIDDATAEDCAEDAAEN